MTQLSPEMYRELLKTGSDGKHDLKQCCVSLGSRGYAFVSTDFTGPLSTGYGAFSADLFISEADRDRVTEIKGHGKVFVVRQSTLDAIISRGMLS